MIKYHGTPFSGDTATAIRALSGGRHALVSYSRPDQLSIVQECSSSHIIDNGAFNAWRNDPGKPFDCQGYSDWLKPLMKHPGFDWYVMPDSIDGGLDENRRLRGEWFNVHGGFDYGVPVFHLDEPLSELSFLALAYERIAIGSAGEYRDIGTVKWSARMAEVMNTVCDSEGCPIVKLHGLRMLDPTVFSVYPFSSCDSSSVARAIGIDKRWTGSYIPKSKEVRAEIMMDRLEHHASAYKWSKPTSPVRNMELFG